MDRQDCEHDWQTGIMGVCPDVCMLCGTTRPHGEGVEIVVTEEDVANDRGAE